MTNRHGHPDPGDETTQQAYYGAGSRSQQPNHGHQVAAPSGAHGNYRTAGPGQYGSGGAHQPPPPPPQYQFAGGYQPPRPPAPPKKRKKWPWVVGAVALLFVIFAVSGGGDQPATPTAGSGQPSSVAPAAPSTGASGAESASESPAGGSGTVVYEVTGEGRASNVTYSSNGSGGQSQRTNVRLPFRQEIQAEEFFGFYSIVAQNGQNGGTLTCKITKDGEVIGEGESEGAFAVVSCNGS